MMVSIVTWKTLKNASETKYAIINTAMEMKSDDVMYVSDDLSVNAGE